MKNRKKTILGLLAAVIGAIILTAATEETRSDIVASVGTATVTKHQVGGNASYVAWNVVLTGNGSGSVTVRLPDLHGQMLAFSADPSVCDANWDFTLTDAMSQDLAFGDGANLSNSTTTMLPTFIEIGGTDTAMPVPVVGCADLEVTNLGASGVATLRFFMLAHQGE